MDLWEKMISGVREAVAGAVAESMSMLGNNDDFLIEQMNIAIGEIRSLWCEPDIFVDPSKVSTLQVKWCQVYLTVQTVIRRNWLLISLWNDCRNSQPAARSYFETSKSTTTLPGMLNCKSVLLCAKLSKDNFLKEKYCISVFYMLQFFQAKNSSRKSFILRIDYG